MHKISIKMRITIWYTLFFLFISVILVSIVYHFTQKLSFAQIKRDLVETVMECLEELQENDNEALDQIEYYDDGIYLSIYDTKYHKIAGSIPDNFPITSPFHTQGIETISVKANKAFIVSKGNLQTAFYVYNRLYQTKTNEAFYVRGVVPYSLATKTSHLILRILLLLSPIFLALVAGGGYWITKKAFQPIQMIIHTVNHITDGNDLRKRIHYIGTQDEISQLAKTFDDMLERLMISFDTKKKFTQDASHELKTPISVITNFCEYALKEIDQKNEVQCSLEAILRQAQKMSTIVSQLLLLSKLDAATEVLTKERFNLSELAIVIVSELRIASAERQITLFEEIENDIMIYGDQTMIMRMLINLINNSITYGKFNGFVKVKMKQEEPNLILIQIIDNGIGIEKEHIDKIWNRFYQVDTCRNRSNDCVGLGLSMVEWIVKAHDGTITVSSCMNEGTTFTIYLPSNL